MKIISNPRATPTRHIPLRTCVACHQKKAKRELIRLVHAPDGKIEVDGSGKKEGRGAYLCREWECWQTGLKGNRLEHTLRGSITQEDREKLINYAKDLKKGAN